MPLKSDNHIFDHIFPIDKLYFNKTSNIWTLDIHRYLDLHWYFGIFKYINTCFNILTIGQFKVQSWWNHSWIGKYLFNKWSNDTSRWKTQVRSQESFATWYLAASCFLGKCIEIQEPGLTAANNRTGHFSSTLEMNRAGQMSVCMM